MKIKIFFVPFILLFLSNCGKVGPLAIPDEILDKSIITYPCNTICLEKFEAEKKRQKSIILQSD
jgi:predicted small lipoprotein YifL